MSVWAQSIFASKGGSHRVYSILRRSSLLNKERQTLQLHRAATRQHEQLAWSVITGNGRMCRHPPPLLLISPAFLVSAPRVEGCSCLCFRSGFSKFSTQLSAAKPYAQLQPWPWPIQPFYWQFFLEKTLFSSPQNTFFLQNRRWCLNISWILSTFLCRRATWTLTFKRLLFVFALHPTSQINIEFSAPCWDPMHAFCRSNLEEYNHYAENKILIMIARNILVYWWSQVKC